MVQHSNEKIQAIQKMLEEKIEDVFENLGVSFRKTNRMFVGKCPVHAGDNNAAFNCYHNLYNSETVFNWRCNTKHCETHFKKTVIGLIRGILSHQEHNWQKTGDKSVGFGETLEWCEDFLQVKLSEIKVEYLDSEKQNFINKFLNRAKVQSGNGFLFQGRKYETAS